MIHNLQLYKCSSTSFKRFQNHENMVNNFSHLVQFKVFNVCECRRLQTRMFMSKNLSTSLENLQLMSHMAKPLFYLSVFFLQLCDQFRQDSKLLFFSSSFDEIVLYQKKKKAQKKISNMNLYINIPDKIFITSVYTVLHHTFFVCIDQQEDLIVLLRSHCPALLR